MYDGDATPQEMFIVRAVRQVEDWGDAPAGCDFSPGEDVPEGLFFAPAGKWVGGWE